MGQYFKAVVLAPQSDKAENEASFESWKYGSGSKQMEHSWCGNFYVSTIEKHFIPGGEFYKHRLVWAGDYADAEAGSDSNLYELSEEKERNGECCKLDDTFRYVVNHSKRQYVDKAQIPVDSDGWQIHPLPLLTAEGNEDAGGEYHSCYPDHHLLGVWARDVISVEETVPAEYTQLKPRFIERRA